MIRFTVLGMDAEFHASLLAARDYDPNDAKAWSVEVAKSLTDASNKARQHHSSVLLFQYSENSPTAINDIIRFRRAAPNCVVCVIMPLDAYPLDEALKIGRLAHHMIDHATLLNVNRLHLALREATSQLAASQVLALLGPGTNPELIQAARICLRRDGSVKKRLLRIRSLLRRGNCKTPGERFDIGVRLLLLVVLMITRNQGISGVYDLAGFRSAGDAGTLLQQYTGFNATALHDPATARQVQIFLIEIVGGLRLPLRKQKPPRQATDEGSTDGNTEDGRR